jgi:hypothetical protein
MKKTGFIMLLLACLLAFMPVVAFAYEADNGIEMFYTDSELITKIDLWEDVAGQPEAEPLLIDAAVPGERYEARPVCSKPVMDEFNFMLVALLLSGVILLSNYFRRERQLKEESIPYIKAC